MGYRPISGAVPQYSRNASGDSADDYYLKFYQAGTTTPLSMATDSTGGTLLAKCALNSRGEPISNNADDTTVFVPHMNADYKIILYPTETDADNNTTANAIFIVDNLSLDFLDETAVATYAAFRALDSSTLTDGQMIFVSGFGHPWEVKTGTVTDNGWYLVFTDDSNRYAESTSPRYSIDIFGAVADSTGVYTTGTFDGTDISSDFQECQQFARTNNGSVYIGPGLWRLGGDVWTDCSIEIDDNARIYVDQGVRGILIGATSGGSYDAPGGTTITASPTNVKVNGYFIGSTSYTTGASAVISVGGDAPSISIRADNMGGSSNSVIKILHNSGTGTGFANAFSIRDCVLANSQSGGAENAIVDIEGCDSNSNFNNNRITGDSSKSTVYGLRLRDNVSGINGDGNSIEIVDIGIFNTAVTGPIAFTNTTMEAIDDNFVNTTRPFAIYSFRGNGATPTDWFRLGPTCGQFICRGFSRSLTGTETSRLNVEVNSGSTDLEIDVDYTLIEDLSKVTVLDADSRIEISHSMDKANKRIVLMQGNIDSVSGSGTVVYTTPKTTSFNMARLNASNKAMIHELYSRHNYTLAAGAGPMALETFTIGQDGTIAIVHVNIRAATANLDVGRYMLKVSSNLAGDTGAPVNWFLDTVSSAESAAIAETFSLSASTGSTTNLQITNGDSFQYNIAVMIQTLQQDS